MYQGKNITLTDFSGGYCGNLRPDQLALNQAQDLDNIVLFPEKKGWRLRNISSRINTGALNAAAPWRGLGIFQAPGGSAIAVIVSGTKIYTNVLGTQTFNDLTGSVTITGASNARWSLFSFGTKMVAFGGVQTSPDVPWEINPTSGNAAILTGTPPSAYGGFTANNRVFAFNTAAAPSTLYWSVLANENDWTGAGSGSSVVGSFASTEPIVAAALLNTNTALIFKKSQVYQVVLTASPFPNYLLFDGVGCIGKNAVVNVDGVVYWVNCKNRMCSTDGRNVTTYPPSADDLWNTVTTIGDGLIGFRQKGQDYDWLVWCGTDTATTTNIAVIWDLINQCWLKCSIGYEFNSAATNVVTGTTYAGTHNGLGYTVGATTTGGDGSTSTTPTPYWRSGWIQPSTSQDIIQPSRFTLSVTPTSGTIRFKYGFNFLADTVDTTISAAAVSTETIQVKRVNLTGRGNFFQFYLGLNTDGTNVLKVSSILLSGKVYGQKRLSAS
jgi:hypothetical protein